MSVTAANSSKFVKVGDVQIHYHDAGEGPVLLMIHGGAPGAFGWGNFGRNMAALSAHFRTIIVDLPGYGKSDKPDVEGSRDRFYAEIFKGMLEQLGIAKAHVLGMATGGGVAFHMAIEWPELIDRLIILSSPGGLQLFTLMPAQLGSQGYYTGDGPSMEKMRTYLEGMLYNKALLTEDVVRERYEASIDPEFMAKAPEGKGGPRRTMDPLWQDLHRVQAPTLVMWGRDNRTVGYDAALFMLNQIPDVRVQIFGQCGLWVPYEKMAEFNYSVIGFLSL
jgi:4,5:9,10-diseco-3-hydroxy-5,9,17-trioxoandrosta-1(10),2-diene-4-oate hydrolase